mmetsp:Transcript_12699/g.22725  ORF Transcript_12699/g.22725 Transcript_12699/m.22725 type:complete len:117 (-) Transcript_12699:263-613(-)
MRTLSSRANSLARLTRPRTPRSGDHDALSIACGIANRSSSFGYSAEFCGAYSAQRKREREREIAPSRRVEEGPLRLVPGNEVSSGGRIRHQDRHGRILAQWFELPARLLMCCARTD